MNSLQLTSATGPKFQFPLNQDTLTEVLGRGDADGRAAE